MPRKPPFISSLNEVRIPRDGETSHFELRPEVSSTGWGFRLCTVPPTARRDCDEARA